MPYLWYPIIVNLGAKKVQMEQYSQIKVQSGSSVTADPPVRSTWSILENSSQFH